MNQVWSHPLSLVLIVPLLASSGLCRGQDAPSPAELVAAVKREHTALEKSYKDERRAAPQGEKDASDVEAKYREASAQHASALQELIKNYPSDPAALDAAMTLYGDVRYPVDHVLAKIILNRHFENEKLGDLCFLLRSHGDEPWAVRILEVCAKKHLRKDVRGQATFALGEAHRRAAIGDIGKARLKKAETRFQQVVESYSDVSTPDGSWNLGERAQHELMRFRNKANLRAGCSAPLIEGKTLDGKSLKLEDHRGKVVVVVFWGSCCGPCMALVPHERDLFKRMKEKPFALLGVNCGDELDVAKKTAKEHRMEWPTFWDGDEAGSGPLQAEYDIQHWPTVIVINAEGLIHAIDVKAADLDAAVDEALAKIGDGLTSP